MNILFLANHLNIGGITSYLLTLTDGLKKRGHQVYLASGGGQLEEKLRQAGAVLINVPMRTKKEISPAVIFSLLKLKKQDKKYNFQIIHAHSRTTQVLGCLLSRSLAIPYISTCHGFFKRRLLRRIFPCWGHRVIAISQQVKEHLARDFAVEEKRIAVIHNGVDVDKFRRIAHDAQRTAKLNFGLGDGPVIGIIARLSDVKGHAYLLEAMPEVLKKIPQARLFIVGEGRMKDELTAQANNLGIGQSVVFSPAVEDTALALAAMDVFVLPSLQEGLGLGLMEAMAAGLSVIGSNVGGIASLIKDGYNGMLVEPRDSQGLAREILALLMDEPKRKSLGERARIFMQENFSPAKMSLETERVYLECASTNY
jgi:glycosyltransferase involved in cell wall biosynthesis